MPTYEVKDKDGKVIRTYEGNEFGDPIDYSVTKYEESPLFKQAPGTSPSITFAGDPTPHNQSVLDSVLMNRMRAKGGISGEPSFADKVFNFPLIGTRNVSPGLQALGGDVGRAIGADIGATRGMPIKGALTGRALGNVAGYLPGLALRSMAPSYFGIVKEPGEELTDMGLNTAADFGSSILAKGANMFVPGELKRIIQESFKRGGNKLNIDQINAIKADPNMPLSVGQVKGGIWDWAERNLAPKAKEEFQKKQIDYLRKQATPHILPDIEDTVRQGQRAGRRTAIGIEKRNDQLYRDFEPAIKNPANTKTVLKEIPGKPSTLINPATNQPYPGVPTYERIKIEGAIPVNKSKQFADNLGDLFDKALGPNDINAASLAQGTGTDVAALRNELNKIRGIQTYLDPKTKQPTSTMASFESLKALRDGLSNFVRQSNNKGVETQLQGGARALRDLLANDMDEGVKAWGPNSYQRYRNAQDYNKNIMQKLRNKTADKTLFAGTPNSPDDTPMALSNWVKSDPQRMRQFIDVAGRNEANALVADDIARTFVTPQGGINVSGTRNYLRNNEGVVREAIPSNNLTNVNRFLTRAELVGPVVSGSKIPLALRYNSAGIGLVLGAGSVLSGSGLPLAGAAGALTIGGTNLAKKFTERVLLNSHTAHLATGLLDADPKSAFAKKATRAILLTLKGTQVEIMAPDNNKYPGIITESGQVKRTSDKPISNEPVPVQNQ